MHTCKYNKILHYSFVGRDILLQTGMQDINVQCDTMMAQKQVLCAVITVSALYTKYGEKVVALWW